jgi:hypothetical protein
MSENKIISKEIHHQRKTTQECNKGSAIIVARLSCCQPKAALRAVHSCSNSPNEEHIEKKRVLDTSSRDQSSENSFENPQSIVNVTLWLSVLAQ